MRFTEEAGIVPHFARKEAERRHQYYLGPEHLLLGLLVGDENPMVTGLRKHGLDLKVGDDNPAARVLRAHGLDLETLRAGIDRLVAQGILPGPQPSDVELLATLGIDLDAVMARLNESFGWEAYYERPRTCGCGRPSPSLTPREPGHRSSAGACSSSWPRRPPPAARTPPPRIGCWRCCGTPKTRSRSPPTATRWNAGSGPCTASPDHGPSPVRLLVESHGWTLDSCAPPCSRNSTKPGDPGALMP
jgi:hypothetical protein